MNVIDQYPSTLDMPRIAGGQDAVEAILVGARKRYKRGATPTFYMGGNGRVCAIGALAREAGLTLQAYQADDEAEFSQWREFRRTLERANVEKPMIDATRDAIKLLNKAAIELFPESRDYGESWSGPLEWINQQYVNDLQLFRSAKKQVLQVYDRAIENRRAALAA